MKEEITEIFSNLSREMKIQILAMMLAERDNLPDAAKMILQEEKKAS